MFTGLLDGGLHLGVFVVAFGIDEEIIFPGLAARGPGVDIGQVDFVLSEDIKDVGQGAGAVGGGEQNGGLVLPGRFGGIPGDDEKSGEVVRVILDFSQTMGSL